jgi:hypothetical protein
VEVLDGSGGEYVEEDTAHIMIQEAEEINWMG